MPRGRPRKPVHLLKLAGTYRPSRHRDREHESPAPGDLPDLAPPAWLTPAQRKIWLEVLADAPAGVLRKIDGRMFGQYCALSERLEVALRAQARLDEMPAASDLPLLVRGPNGARESPYIRLIDRTILALTRLAAELGFTPVARARLGTSKEPTDPGVEGDTWAVLRRFPRAIEGGKGTAESPGRKRRAT
jgi:phage terminase small subunit